MPPNGSTVHFSFSTPTTSAWDARRTGRRLPSPRSRAIRCDFPATGVGTMTVSNPRGRSFAASRSSIWASCPGGLLVSSRMSSWSKAAVGLRLDCARVCANSTATNTAPATADRLIELYRATKRFAAKTQTSRQGDDLDVGRSILDGQDCDARFEFESTRPRGAGVHDQPPAGVAKYERLMRVAVHKDVGRVSRE